MAGQCCPAYIDDKKREYRCFNILLLHPHNRVPYSLVVTYGIHVNPERICGGTNGEVPSEASQLRKGGPGVTPRTISKTYIANGAMYVIPELYL